jgi:hypothetical protein
MPTGMMVWDKNRGCPNLVHLAYALRSVEYAIRSENDLAYRSPSDAGVFIGMRERI